MTVQYTPRDLIDKISQNNYSYTNSYVKKIAETDANIAKLQDKADTFKKNVKKLKKYSPGGISRDMLETQLEDLVKSYNDMKNSSSKVTDKDLQKQLSKLEKLFSDNEKELKKIGIENVNGKYAFNSKTYEKASDKNINALLVGHDSFIGQADKILRKVDARTDDLQFHIIEQPMRKTLNYQESDMVQADNYMTLAGKTTAALKASNALVQSDQIADDDVQESIKSLLTDFAQSVYRTDTSVQSAYVAKLNQLCLNNSIKLAKLGLTFDDDEKNLVFDDRVDLSSDDFRNTYNELFGENAAFGNTVADYCKSIFSDIIQPGKIGVSILDDFV